MKQGLTLEEMARAVQRQSERKQDYVVDTRDLIMLNGSELSLPVEATAAGIGQHREEFDVGQIAHRQIGERLGIPAKFYDSLCGDGNEEVKRLLDTNVNTLFRERPERRMVRTFGPVVGVTLGEHGGQGVSVSEPGVARAFLSDRYRRLDNNELLAAVVPILGEIPEVRFESSGLTDSRFYLKAVTPRQYAKVVGDEVCAGVVIRNSEVGHGSLSVQPMVFTLSCTNGMIAGKASRHYHVGRHVEAEAESTRVFSDATLRLDDRALMAKLADVVKAAVDATTFHALVAQLRGAQETTKLADVKLGVERLGKRFSLDEGEQASVLQHLAEGGDLTAYGALNAITRASQDIESYDRATELEVVGGELLAIAGTKEWEAIAA